MFNDTVWSCDSPQTLKATLRETLPPRNRIGDAICFILVVMALKALV